MSFSVDYDKYKKGSPRDYDDYTDDDLDFEYSDEFIYEDEFGETDRYYL